MVLYHGPFRIQAFIAGGKGEEGRKYFFSHYVLTSKVKDNNIMIKKGVDSFGLDASEVCLILKIYKTSLICYKINSFESILNATF